MQKDLVDLTNNIEKVTHQKSVLQQELDIFNSKLKQINERLAEDDFEEVEETFFDEEMEFRILESKSIEWEELGNQTIEKIKQKKEIMKEILAESKLIDHKISTAEQDCGVARHQFNQIQETKTLTEHLINELTKSKLELEKQIFLLELEENSKSNFWISKFRSEVSRLQSLNSNINGVLADLGSTDEKYSKSVNTVLSSVLINSVVVESHKDALHVVNHFKNNKIGVVSCLILQEMECNTKDIYHPKLINMSSVIQCNKKYETCFKKFTNHWYIAETLEDAISISKQDSIKRNIVTLGGEVFKSGGEIKSKRTSSFPITLKKQGTIESDHQEFSNCTNNFSIQKLKEELKSIDVELKKERDNLLSMNEHRIEKILTNHVQNLDELKIKNRECLKKSEEIQNEILSLERKIEKLKLNREEEERYQYLRRKKHHLEEGELKSKRYQEKQKLEILKTIKEKSLKIANSETKLSDLVAQSEKKKLEISELKDLTKMLNGEISHSEVTKITKIISSLTKQIHNLEDEKNTIQNDIRKVKKLMDEKFKRKLNFESQLKSLNNANAKLKSDLESLDKVKPYSDLEWKKMLKNDKSSCQQELAQIQYNLTQESKLISNLKNEIDIEMVEKDQHLIERTSVINQEFDAIESKIQSTFEKINELSTKRYEKFHENCQRLNDSLSYIFQNINPSSNCCLKYTENKSSAFEEGVVIHCKTDGSWKPFSNLSGGQQAICACALSLSFQLICPCPIFFYDEIDASLDVSNTEKLAKLLKSMKNQFICISLRPNMYEISSTLIGVYNCENSSRTVCKKFE